MTHANITLSVDISILEQFRQFKSEIKLSHLVEFWIKQFLKNKKGFIPAQDTNPKPQGGS